MLKFWEATAGNLQIEKPNSRYLSNFKFSGVIFKKFDSKSRCQVYLK